MLAVSGMKGDECKDARHDVDLKPVKLDAKINAMQPSVLKLDEKESGSKNYVTAKQLEQSQPYPGVE